MGERSDAWLAHYQTTFIFNSWRLQNEEFMGIEETRARIERATAERKKAQTDLEHWTSRLQVLEEALRLETIGLMPPEQRGGKEEEP